MKLATSMKRFILESIYHRVQTNQIFKNNFFPNDIGKPVK